MYMKIFFSLSSSSSEDDIEIAAISNLSHIFKARGYHFVFLILQSVINHVVSDIFMENVTVGC